MKYIYLALGSLLTIAVIAGVVITTDNAFADDISVYLPIFGGGESSDNVEASGLGKGKKEKFSARPNVAPRAFVNPILPTATPLPEGFMEELERQMEEEERSRKPNFGQEINFNGTTIKLPDTAYIESPVISEYCSGEVYCDPEDYYIINDNGTRIILTTETGRIRPKVNSESVDIAEFTEKIKLEFPYLKGRQIAKEAIIEHNKVISDVKAGRDALEGAKKRQAARKAAKGGK